MRRDAVRFHRPGTYPPGRRRPSLKRRRPATAWPNRTAGLSEPAEPDSVASPPVSAAEPIQGYRVQLYSFTSRELAEAALDQVKQTLAEWSYGVYLQEESGSFKIRVGDFEDKADADILRDWFRRKGFVDAWTAGTLIPAP